MKIVGRKEKTIMLARLSVGNDLFLAVIDKI